MYKSFIFILVLISVNIKAQINLSDGLVAYLPLNANGLDITGVNNGTVSTAGAYPTSNLVGLANSAMLFNGSIEKGQVTLPSSLLNNLTSMTISGWIAPSAFTSTNQSVFGQDNVMEIYTTNSPNRITVWTPAGSVSSNLTAATATWYHILITTSTTGIQLFVNGVLAGSANGNYTLTNSAFTTNIGGNVLNQTGQYFDGRIDEFRLYNRVLNADEISLLASSASISMNINEQAISNTKLCSSQTLKLPFNITGSGIDTTNVFTAQLSDAFGSFKSPVSIVSKAGNKSDTIQAVIPKDIPNGSNYKIRIVSSFPMLTGAATSVTFTIQNPSDSWSTLSRNRLVWYKFNSNAADSSGNKMDAATQGGTSFITDRFGAPNAAIQLNGTTGYVNVPADVWFNGNYTVSCWIKPTAYNSWSRIYDFGNGSGSDNMLTALSNSTNGYIHAEQYNGSSSVGNADNGSTKLSLNQWSHFCVTYDGTNLKVFVNGRLAISSKVTPERFVKRLNCYIGRSNWSSDAYANAAFDDFMIYNRLLTDDEINALANDGTIFTASPVCSGGSISLNCTDIPGATYKWSGPAGFSSTKRENIITNASTINSGSYSLSVSFDNCSAFSQTKDITVLTNNSQPTLTISGLADFTDSDNSAITITATPTGGFFTGDGIAGNQFIPANAGIGSHIIIYNYMNSGGCLSTTSKTIQVNPSYKMQNATITACSGGFYDSGGNNSNYSSNENSVTTFCSDNGLPLQFNFKSLSFATGDTLFAFDGNTTNDKLIAYYLNSPSPDVIWSSGSCMTFMFKSDATNAGTGWQATFQCMQNPALSNQTIKLSSGYKAVCNVKITDPSGFTGYPQTDVKQTFSSTDGSRLKFKFTSFDINGNNGGHWISIYDGPSTSYPLIGSYNNYNWYPANIESTGSTLTFEFNSNNTNAGFGAKGFAGNLTCTTPPLTVFNMQNSTDSTCSGVFYDDAGANMNYSNDKYLTQTFCSKGGQQTEITFNSKETSFNTGDTLWAYDGNDTKAPLLGVYLAGSKIEKLTSSANCLTFKFYSNSTNATRGWQGIINCVNTAAAANTYTMSSGTRYVCSGELLDPGGTGNYSIGGTYKQTFTSYSGERIRATMKSFAVNGNNGGHWLSVYDGASTSSALIGKYNNFNWSPAAFQSTGSSLTFYFDATNNSAAANAGFDYALTCFTGEPIDIAWLNSPVCQGEALSIPFTLNATVTDGNIYTAQISDSLGDFNHSRNIGTLTSTAATATINALIPSDLPAGSGYRVRILSSMPIQISSISPNPITIVPKVKQPAKININGSSSFCNGAGSSLLSIDKQKGANYQWILNDSSIVGINSNTITATKAGKYRVKISNNCDTLLSDASLVIDAIYKPNSTIITASGDTSFCPGGQIELNVPTQNGANYQWTHNGTNINTANTNVFTAIKEGAYNIALSNICGTTNSSNTINVHILALPVISLSKDSTILTNQTITLDAGDGFATYLWSDGSNSRSVTINAEDAGTGLFKYTVTVSNSDGCKASASINLTIDQYLYAISGTLTYDNQDNTPLANTAVTLSFADGKLIKIRTTNTNGKYIFYNIDTGLYKVEPNIKYNWGGSDPGDALMINRYYIGAYSFTDSLRLKAADVNLDYAYNPGDALMINRKYIGAISSFVLPDWMFDVVPVKVNAANAIYNIKTICSGDPNGSFVPSK